MQIYKLTTTAVAVLMAATTPLLGQEQKIAAAPKNNMWIPIGILFMLTLAVLIGSFMSSRRGHQD